MPPRSPWMNDNPKKPLTITLTGMFTFAQDEWEQLMRQFLVASRISDTPPLARGPQLPEGDSKLPRLAFSVKETAGILGISEKTVANHLSHIFTKTQSENRAAATAFALRAGLA